MEEIKQSHPADEYKNHYKSVVGYYGFWVRLTYINAVIAVFGIHFALAGNIRYALVCLMLSGLCDGLDGKIANLKDRTVREKSYGIQIDSLADIISFGVLPAAIGYALIAAGASQGLTIAGTLIFAGYVLAALIRLAYFNVMETELINSGERRKYFEGLPVTSAALIIPVIYSVCDILNAAALPAVYCILLAILSAAFLLRIKIPKPRGRTQIILCVTGLPAIIYIIFFGGA
jgi:CDP-diacylglycerol--serine O-phosphatidyltransferase